MKPLIKKLTETLAPSGYENAIREVILEEINPLVDDTRVDASAFLLQRFLLVSSSFRKLAVASFRTMALT